MSTLTILTRAFSQHKAFPPLKLCVILKDFKKEWSLLSWFPAAFFSNCGIRSLGTRAAFVGLFSSFPDEILPPNQGSHKVKGKGQV